MFCKIIVSGNLFIVLTSFFLCDIIHTNFLSGGMVMYKICIPVRNKTYIQALSNAIGI